MLEWKVNTTDEVEEEMYAVSWTVIPSTIFDK
jgi:hypothetical protein